MIFGTLGMLVLTNASVRWIPFSFGHPCFLDAAESEESVLLLGRFEVTIS